MSQANENMEIWSRVCETPPQHTKEVSFGSRRFTAVDAYFQIQRATDLWGPLGIGWGYDVDLLERDEFYIADFKLWYRSGETISKPIRVFGLESKYETAKKKDAQGNVTGTFKKPDLEAPKKAVTDALTKALSYLGFSADVYTGRYDDNRYVADMRRKYGLGQGNGASQNSNQAQSAGQHRSRQPDTQNQSSRQSSDNKPFNAKYGGNCSVCGGEINVGDVIYWSNNGGARHSDCHPGR